MLVKETLVSILTATTGAINLFVQDFRPNGTHTGRKNHRICTFLPTFIFPLGGFSSPIVLHGGDVAYLETKAAQQSQKIGCTHFCFASVFK